MVTFEEVLRILGLFLRVLGMLAFGISGGWFTLKAFKHTESGWQLQAVVYGVFFIVVALLTRYTSPGSIGGFMLGVSGAFIFWGLLKEKEPTEGEKEE